MMFLREQGTTLRSRVAGMKMWMVHVRIPAVDDGCGGGEVRGRPLEVVADPGSYLAIRRRR